MVTHHDTEGTVVTAEESARITRHIVLEGDRHHSEPRLVRDITTFVAPEATELLARPGEDGPAG